jgi:hypothetical protein
MAQIGASLLALSFRKDAIMTITVYPYEFLVRWDQTGALSGAQVQWRKIRQDDDGDVTETVTSAQPVSVGNGDGFPLADVLSKVHVDALLALDQARAERDALAAQIQAIETAR